MKRRLLYAGAGMGALLVAALAWLLMTESGLRFLVATVLPRVPVEIAIGQVSGRLSDRVVLQDLRISDGIVVSIRRLEAEPQLLRLAVGTLRFSAVAADGLDVALPPADNATSAPGTAAPAFAPPQLPVAISIDQLAIDDVAVRREQARLAALRRVAAEGLSLQTDRWRARRFEFDGSPLSGTGALDLETGGNRNVRIDFKGILEATDSEIEIISEIEGDADKLVISAGLTGGLQAQLDGELRHWARAPEWTFDARAEAADLGLVSQALPAGPLALDLAGHGDAASARFDGSIAWRDLPVYDLALSALRHDGAVALERLTLSQRDGEFAAEFDGTVVLAESFPAADGTLRWSSMTWPPGAISSALIVSPSGQVRINGEKGNYRIAGGLQLGPPGEAGTLEVDGAVDFAATPATADLSGNWEGLAFRWGDRLLGTDAGRFRLRGNADRLDAEAGFRVTGPGWPSVDVDLAATGTPAGIDVSRLELVSTGGLIRGQGSVALKATRDFDFSLQAEQIDPGLFDPQWPGALSFAAGLSGQFADEGMTARITLDDLRGRLRGAALTGRGKLKVDRGRPGETDLDLRWGEAVVVARGTLGERLDFRWRATVPDVSTFVPGASGSIESRGQLAGNHAAPAAEASMVASGLAYKGFSTAALSASLVTAGAGGEQGSLKMTASDVVIGDVALARAVVEGSGTVSDHDVSVSVDGDAASLKTSLRGGYSATGWSGAVRGTSLELKSGTWSQSGAASVRLSRDAWSMTRACLGKQQASVCASAAGDDGHQLKVDIQDLPLVELGVFLPAGLEYEGTVAASVQVDTLRPPAATGRFEVRDGRVWQNVEDEQRVLLDFSRVDGQARVSAGQLRIEASLLEPGGLQASAEAALPMSGWSPGAGPVSARIEGSTSSIGIMAILFPDLAQVAGRLEARVDVSGTVAAPRWQGFIALVDATALVPALGLKLEDMRARVDADGNALRVSAGTVSGPGRIELDGQVTLGEEGPFGQLQLSGEDFQASNLPEAVVLVSPDVTLDLQGRALRLTGRVSVPSARIAPRDLSGAVQRSADERVIREQTPDGEEAGWQVSSKVEIVFGKAVSFDGFGLEAGVSGSLEVSDEPGRVTTATGEVLISDGTYSAYGRDLEIRRGRLLFTGGPLANPGLDVLAVRTIEADGVEAGVIARGSLRTPDISLYSSPAMTPSQTLSYLLVGQPIADLGGSDRALVDDTVSRLAAAGGGLLAQQLGRRIGLEDVAVRGAGSEQASLVIGKYLSPRLYASYGIGLFEPVNTLRLQYLLSSRWKLRAESGVNQSVDLEFTLER